MRRERDEKGLSILPKRYKQKAYTTLYAYTAAYTYT